MVDIVCPQCGAVLTINASDVKVNLKTRTVTYFAYRCDWCKRKSIVNAEQLTDELIKEYMELNTRQ